MTFTKTYVASFVVPPPQRYYSFTKLDDTPPRKNSKQARKEGAATRYRRNFTKPTCDDRLRIMCYRMDVVGEDASVVSDETLQLHEEQKIKDKTGKNENFSPVGALHQPLQLVDSLLMR